MSYPVSSTGSSDELSDVPSETSANDSSLQSSLLTQSYSPAKKHNPDSSKLTITGPNPKGRLRTYRYAHFVDWTSTPSVAKLNRWRSQATRRTTGRTTRNPGPRYLPIENEFLIDAHRAVKAGEHIDWKATTAAFNERFADKVVEGDMARRPQRSRGSLIAQRDRVPEIRVLRGKLDARRDERPRGPKGVIIPKAKATAAVAQGDESVDADEEDEVMEGDEDEDEEMGDADDEDSGSDQDVKEEEDDE